MIQWYLQAKFHLNYSFQSPMLTPCSHLYYKKCKQSTMSRIPGLKLTFCPSVYGSAIIPILSLTQHQSLAHDKATTKRSLTTPNEKTTVRHETDVERFTSFPPLLISLCIKNYSIIYISSSRGLCPVHTILLMWLNTVKLYNHRGCD